MNIPYFSLLLALTRGLVGSNVVPEPQIEWAVSAIGSGWHTQSTGIVADEYGNTYIVGHFTGETTFGSISLSPSGDGGMFIVKYSSAGEVVWAKSVGESGISWPNDIAINHHGNLIVTGQIASGILNKGPGVARIGKDELSTQGTGDMVLFAMDSNGNFLWSLQAGCDSNAVGNSVGIDPKGNLFVTGSFEGRFGRSGPASAGTKDIFLAKYSASRKLLWVRTAGGKRFDQGTSVAIDKVGNCYVTGHFVGEAEFGRIRLKDTGSVEFFLAKYSPKGDLLWVRRGNSQSTAEGLAIDSEGSAFVGGSFGDTLRYGKSTIISSSSPRSTLADRDAFITKTSKNGKPLWAVQGGGNIGYDDINSLATDSKGNVYFTGTFYGNASFNGIELKHRPLASPRHHYDRQAFFGKYDANGGLLWIEQSKQLKPYEAHGQDITTDLRGNCYVTGFYMNSVQLGPFHLKGANDRFAGSIFTAKIKSQ